MQCLLLIWLLAVASTSATAADAPLADAAERQDRAALQTLLAQHADVNQSQPDGMTALHWTVLHEDAESTDRLLQAGADVKAATRYGVSALAIACTSGNGAMIERLLVAGADANAPLSGGETPLMTASRTGRREAVRALLARGADPNAKERKGQTALMWAAAEGHADVVQTLLDAGADFRTSLASGFTPLLFAVREGRAEAVAVLLKAGADVNEAIVVRRRPPHRAARSGTSPLLLAIENGHFDLALKLLDAGADPNDERTGFTPLHTITWVRKPNRGDGEDGDPPPSGSGQTSSLDFVRQLVARGADVNRRLKRGNSGKAVLGHAGATPLLLAAKTADVPLLRLLVELGADPLVANSEGSTPLMAAAGLGTRAPGEEAGTEAESLAAVTMLLDLGADVNAVDDKGETAMHGAAYKNLPRVVQLLAARGAKVEVWNRPNQYGWTPLANAPGYRVGNFKPSPETLTALKQAMRDAGLTPPDHIPPPGEKAGYEAP